MRRCNLGIMSGEVGQGWWRTSVAEDLVAYGLKAESSEDYDIVVSAGREGVSVHGVISGGCLFDGPSAVGLMTVIAIATEQHCLIASGSPARGFEADVQEMTKAISYANSLRS